LQVGTGTFIDVRTFSSGIYSLDWAMGCGGVPRGRTIEIFGSESSGKTTVTLKMIASCQHTIVDGEPGTAAFIDAEHALDPEWARANGVDLDRMLLSQPDSGEEAIAIAEILIRSGIQLVVVDSVAALVPQKELEGEITDHNIGLQARLMSKACRVLTPLCKKHLSTIVFINQIREKIGVTFGSPETTPGGRALKYYASVRIDMRSISMIKDDDLFIGRKTKAKIIKNKVAPPWKTADIEIFFGVSGQKPFPIWGADERYSLIKAGLLTDVIKLNNTYYKYGDKNLGNGMHQTVKTLTEDEALFIELRDKILEAVRPKVTVEAKDTEDEPDIEDDDK
jgi:recombination protein RecA